MAETAPDLILAPVASGEIASLPPLPVPLVYSSDATFRLNVDVYPAFRDLSRRERRDADAIERAAIARADVVAYPSTWAARSAIEDYGAPPDKVVVIPYGANLGDELPRASPRRAPRSVLRALFLGVDWERKGGDVAVEAVSRVRARGWDVRLSIVGATPDSLPPQDGIDVVGFLDKRRPDQVSRLAELFRESDVLLLPTRAECWGIVFAEAAHHGVPVVATRTGGVGDVVLDGRTGMLVDVDDPESTADSLERLLTDPELYRALSAASLTHAREVLDWGVWADRLASELEARALIS